LSAEVPRGVGKIGFVEEHGLADDAYDEAAARSVKAVEDQDIQTVRMIWVDQHGVPRCKFMSAADYVASLKSGIDFSGALVSMDTANNVFLPAFAQDGGLGIPEMTGFPDFVVVPDPTTFATLSFADRTAWVLTDAYFSNGKPMPLDSRRILRDQLTKADAAGYEYLSGLEVEFYVVRLETPGHLPYDQTGWPPPVPPVSAIAHGYQYLSEVRLGGVNSLLESLRDALNAAGLPLRSMEDEWGPGQLEITMDPMVGMGTADAMILFRSITKQVCAQQGLMASFMCRPSLPNAFSSGWHLHESLRSKADGTNAFTSSDDQTLSPVGRHFVAGILEHAAPSAIFANPTITGYKRMRPYSFAPDRAAWADENRGSMVRVQAAPGEAGAHIENRLGEPAANPYLYLAANVAAGMDGVSKGQEPPAAVAADPYAQDDAERLPANLWDAVDALEQSEFFRDAFGSGYVDYYAMMKRNEVKRFFDAVTDWEMREYFEFF
jgi:glutamine synthetase